MYAQTETLEELLVKPNGNGNATSKLRVPKLEHGTVQTTLQSQSKVTAAQVKAYYESQLHAALTEAKMNARKEVAEPQDWWDVLAVGPIQIGAQSIPPAGFQDSPLLPHQVIRVGEDAYVVTILLLNPFGPGAPSAADILSGFGLPYEVRYSTGNLDTWNLGPNYLNVTQGGNFTPFVPFAVDVFKFTAKSGDEACYEMNICARIFGCDVNGKKNSAPPFAGFAREVIDIDPGLLFPAPGLQVDTGIRFQIYE